LLVSERGKHGGYRLARPAREISMLAIVEALEGEIRPVGCIDSRDLCAQGGSCLPRLFWLGLKETVDGYLSSRSLKDVLEGEADDGSA
ncbi:MAG: Rrf2 family transcriptional regulator, partial [Spirochaetota bacterium]